jgi:hypothetical protein
MRYPITVVDNFYDDADKVREYALSLPYEITSQNYPGTRTKNLHYYDRDFFEYSTQKFFSLFHENINPVQWNVSTAFQLIEPYDNEKYNIKNLGWIHRDDDVAFAAIIYLTPNADVDSGTRIYKLKENSIVDLNQEARFSLYSGNTVGNEYEEAYWKHRNMFEETLNVKNYYNRLVSFDSSCWHGVDTIYNDQPRLTQVFFVHSFETASASPLERANNYKY